MRSRFHHASLYFGQYLRGKRRCTVDDQLYCVSWLLAIDYRPSHAVGTVTATAAARLVATMVHQHFAGSRSPQPPVRPTPDGRNGREGCLPRNMTLRPTVYTSNIRYEDITCFQCKSLIQSCTPQSIKTYLFKQRKMNILSFVEIINRSTLAVFFFILFYKRFSYLVISVAEASIKRGLFSSRHLC